MYLLAYGPHIPLQKNLNVVQPFEYQVYLYHSIEPQQSAFKIAYGNRPLVPIEILPLETGIGKEFIANLDEDLLRFLVLANHLLEYTDYRRYPFQFSINSKHLTHGRVPQDASKNSSLSISSRRNPPWSHYVHIPILITSRVQRPTREVIKVGE